MAGSVFTFKKGTSDPTATSGLTLGEPAFNTTTKRFFMGLGTGITAAWVGAPITGASSDIQLGLTGSVPTASAVKYYVTALESIGTSSTALIIGSTTGQISIRNPSIVLGSNGGNTTISTPSGSTNGLLLSPMGMIAFTPTSASILEGDYVSLTLTNDKEAAGLVMFAGGDIHLGTKVASEGGTPTAVNIIFEGASANDHETTLTLVDPTADRTITLPDATGTVALTATSVASAVAGTGISVSGATGAVTITNTGVQTFNGTTGAVTGVTVGGANTFTALQTFSAGISASGATFSSNVYMAGDLVVTGRIVTSTGVFGATDNNITEPVDNMNMDGGEF